MTFLLAAVLAACTVDTTKPQEVAYDRVACGHCGMMVGDPKFTAQLWTKEGRWAAFDDPVCAFRYVAEHAAAHDAVWFRDGSADRDVWLPWDQAGFVPATGAPMDGGLMAVPRATAGAMSVADASAKATGGKTP